MLSRLLADAQLADYVAVAVRVVRLQVIQQATALADEHQETAPRGVILLVGFEMLSQLADTRTQNRNLDFRRAGVGVVSTEAFNQVSFGCRCQHSVLVTPGLPEVESPEKIIKSFSMSPARLPRIAPATLRRQSAANQSRSYTNLKSRLSKRSVDVATI